MIIDCHAHVFAFPKIIPGPGKTTFMSAEEQISLMDSKGIDKAVILPLNNPESPTEPQSIGEILYICQKYPGRFIPFCNLDTRLPKIKEKITVDDFDFLIRQYKDIGCKGLGELTARIPWNDSALLKLLEACERNDFAITFHTIASDVNSYGVIDEVGLPGLESILKKFPKLKFLGHSLCFWSEISGALSKRDKNSYPKGRVIGGGAVVRLMKRYPNLYGDLSAGSGFNALQRDPQHAWKFIDEFQNRLLLGLDYCSTTNDMQHIEWLTQAKDDGYISKKAYEKIMWKNINKALKLKLKGS